jgi:phenylacetate-CoA ligase
MRAAAACSLDRAAIEEHQIQQMQSLLATVLERNPFYSAKLKEAGVTPKIKTLSEFTAKAPFTYKAELAADQLQHPSYGSNHSCPLSQYTRFHQTSGTTGRPMRWLDTPESWDWMIDCWTRVFETAGVRPDDRVFFPFSFGPFLGFWVAFDAASRMGCLAISGGGMPSVARLQTILDNEVTVLCTTPTYALHLAEIAAENRFDLSSGKVRRIIVAGEPGGSIPATRALIEKLWPGARVVDHHGMTEIGPVTYECPEQRGTLHVMEAAFFAEVIDPETGVAVAPGEDGELVLTNFGRLGSPLLRYRTGDMVRRAADTRCRCGSYEMALRGGILARRDGMVIVRGVNVYPSAVEDVLRSCGIVEFRVQTYTQRALVEMNIEIEPESDCDDTVRLSKDVGSALRNALGLRVEVKCVARGSLPRFEGKAKRWVRR